MTILTRLRHGIAQFTRGMTIGRLAAAYVVALVLGGLGLFIIQGAVLSTGGRTTFGVQVAFAISFVLLWGGVLIFVAFSLAGLARLVRAMAGR